MAQGSDSMNDIPAELSSTGGLLTARQTGGLHLQYRSKCPQADLAPDIMFYLYLHISSRESSFSAFLTLCHVYRFTHAVRRGRNCPSQPRKAHAKYGGAGLRPEMRCNMHTWGRR